jgi:hypothetical protein
MSAACKPQSAAWVQAPRTPSLRTGASIELSDLGATTAPPGARAAGVCADIFTPTASPAPSRVASALPSARRGAAGAHLSQARTQGAPADELASRHAGSATRSAEHGSAGTAAGRGKRWASAQRTRALSGRRPGRVEALRPATAPVAAAVHPQPPASTGRFPRSQGAKIAGCCKCCNLCEHWDAALHARANVTDGTLQRPATSPTRMRQCCQLAGTAEATVEAAACGSGAQQADAGAQQGAHAVHAPTRRATSARAPSEQSLLRSHARRPSSASARGLHERAGAHAHASAPSGAASGASCEANGAGGHDWSRLTQSEYQQATARYLAVRRRPLTVSHCSLAPRACRGARVCQFVALITTRVQAFGAAAEKAHSAAVGEWTLTVCEAADGRVPLSALTSHLPDSLTPAALVHRHRLPEEDALRLLHVLHAATHAFHGLVGRITTHAHDGSSLREAVWRAHAQLWEAVLEQLHGGGVGAALAARDAAEARAAWLEARLQDAHAAHAALEARCAAAVRTRAADSPWSALRWRGVDSRSHLPTTPVCSTACLRAGLTTSLQVRRRKLQRASRPSQMDRSTRAWRTCCKPQAMSWCRALRRLAPAQRRRRAERSLPKAGSQLLTARYAGFPIVLLTANMPVEPLLPERKQQPSVQIVCTIIRSYDDAAGRTAPADR